MSKKITTPETENKFKEIIKAYVDFFQSNEDLKKNHIELKLILLKIGSNLQAANLLWSRNGFNDAKILLRSAFEALVLFEYLATFPQEISKYKDEDKITKFKNLFGYFKRGHLGIEKLIECYSELSETTRKLIPFEETSEKKIITYDVKELEIFFKKKFKLNFQNVHSMMKELKKAENPNYKTIYLSSLKVYNIGSQITHNSYSSLVESFATKSTDKEILEQIKGCFRDSAEIIIIIIGTLKRLINLKDEFALYDKVLHFYEYLGYDLTPYKKQAKNKSNLIEIVTFSQI